MRRLLHVLVIVLAALALAAGAFAITYGEPDGTAHPEVGILFADSDPASPGLEPICSGSLIAPRVFLTAGHCTAGLDAAGIPNDIWVSFDPSILPFPPASAMFHGHWVTNPAFSKKQSDPGDLAVVLLDIAPGAAPAQLPKAGLLDQIPLEGQTFTAVGYGFQERVNGGGQPYFPFDGLRRRAVSTFSSLNNAWLRLSQNPAHGNGGTCFGDSGGPNFLGSGASETKVIAGMTGKGDAVCRNANTTVRVDTPAARAFLGNFVTLP